MAVFNAFVTMVSLVRTVPPAKILMNVLKIQPYVKMAYASMTRYVHCVTDYYAHLLICCKPGHRRLYFHPSLLHYRC